MPEHRRLSRLHRNTFEQNLDAKLGKNFLDEIILTHGDTAGDEQHVVLQATPNLCAKVFQVVPAVTKRYRFGAGSNDLCVKGVAVAVPDLSARRRLTDFNKFVSGGEDRNAGFSRHENFSLSKAGQRADVGYLNASAG